MFRCDAALKAARGRRTESTAEHACEMGLVGKPGGVRGSGETAAAGDLADGGTQAVPRPIAAERHPDLAREQMLEAGCR